MFLDIDGVLLPFGGDTAALDEPTAMARCMAALAELISAAASSSGRQPRVVVSSTWRCSPEAMDEIRANFLGSGPVLAAVELDATTDKAYHGWRRTEIARWLLANPAAAAAPFVVLDDDAPVPRLRHHF